MIDGELANVGSLEGTLSGTDSLEGTLSDMGQLAGGLTIPEKVDSVKDYEKLKNKPSIESVTLVGDKTFEQLGLSSISTDDLLEILS